MLRLLHALFTSSFAVGGFEYTATFFRVTAWTFAAVMMREEMTRRLFAPSYTLYLFWLLSFVATTARFRFFFLPLLLLLLFALALLLSSPKTYKFGVSGGSLLSFFCYLVCACVWVCDLIFFFFRTAVRISEATEIGKQIFFYFFIFTLCFIFILFIFLFFFYFYFF